MAQQNPKTFYLPGVVTCYQEGEKWLARVGEGPQVELPAGFDVTDTAAVKAFVKAQEAKEAPPASAQ